MKAEEHAADMEAAVESAEQHTLLMMHEQARVWSGFVVADALWTNPLEINKN